MVSSAGEALLIGRSHEFGNTLRLINLHRGFSWLSGILNGVSDYIWRTDVTPRIAFDHAKAGVDRFKAVACSAGAVTAFLSGACSPGSTLRYSSVMFRCVRWGANAGLLGCPHAQRRGRCTAWV